MVYFGNVVSVWIARLFSALSPVVFCVRFLRRPKHCYVRDVAVHQRVVDGDQGAVRGRKWFNLAIMPTAPAIFFSMLLICVFQLSRSSIVIPRYVNLIDICHSDWSTLSSGATA